MQNQDGLKILRNTLIILILLVVLCFAFIFDLSGIKLKKTSTVTKQEKQELEIALVDAVQPNWENTFSKKNHAEIFVQIDSKGNILYIQPITRTESTKTAVSSLMKSAPFKNLPIKNNNDICIQFEFDDSYVNAHIMTKQEDTVMTANTPKRKQSFCQILNDNLKNDLSGYNQALQKKIDANWNPPTVANSRVVVDFDISRSGQADNIRVVNSSKKPFADIAALNAVKNTKFDPLPENIKNDRVSFREFFMVTQEVKQ